MATTTTVRVPIKSRPFQTKAEPEIRTKILKDQSIESIAECINQGKGPLLCGNESVVNAGFKIMAFSFHPCTLPLPNNVEKQQAKKIIVMTGAGISTAAGIKDFRSPGTGLYDDLGKYNLPFPEAVFDFAFFEPTLTHYLLSLLAKKGLLLRSYTQNIDSLETMAGLSKDLLVEAHGSFSTSRCIRCKFEVDSDWVKRHIMRSITPYCKRCGGFVKPDITFFGEDLPRRFGEMSEVDFPQCDLLIVLGTSLKVEPFNKLITQVNRECPRLLINREKAGQEMHSGFDFDDKWKYTFQRDAWFLGDCDEGVRKLASLCGWEEELISLFEAGTAKLDKAAMIAEQKALNPKRLESDEDEDDENMDPGDESDSEDEDGNTVHEPNKSLLELMKLLDSSKLDAKLEESKCKDVTAHKIEPTSLRTNVAEIETGTENIKSQEIDAVIPRLSVKEVETLALPPLALSDDAIACTKSHELASKSESSDTLASLVDQPPSEIAEETNDILSISEGDAVQLGDEVEKATLKTETEEPELLPASSESGSNSKHETTEKTIIPLVHIEKAISASTPDSLLSTLAPTTSMSLSLDHGTIITASIDDSLSLTPPPAESGRIFESLAILSEPSTPTLKDATFPRTGSLSDDTLGPVSAWPHSPSSSLSCIPSSTGEGSSGPSLPRPFLPTTFNIPGNGSFFPVPPKSLMAKAIPSRGKRELEDESTQDLGPVRHQSPSNDRDSKRRRYES
ncbi:NAD-dependent protein deacetylase sirtuin-2 [Podila humilis]|nr:NAD-dependent protein deacetylase sirtuin-2 [Podila humilis]